ncbi:colicin V processing peptidase. Cysteine peptidase. MEROPS family C39 [Roseateles sp. YR242]|uniref:peptidase domain-containing ABC transporter n=1 Tax=Roseateles sp. YR242 TaxID=1855305 RepID=UPI0008C0508D|nr:peptidase domain-containing ABC transporter [Roseateles sp. YR242]SEK31829.1 colicin V processing peptidase. Cysteine peptidase. MEROPS family C39 [Roseateles sp. YR242]
MMALLNLNFWQRQSLPIILQTESAECGLACLCMIASFWGRRMDLRTLRSRYPVSLKGATLKQLMSTASEIQLVSRPLKLDMSYLPSLKTPCILFWDLNHFVVLKEVRRQAAVIHDPRIGSRTLTLDEVSSHFTGVALELSPTSDFHSKDERQSVTLRSLIGNVTGLKRGLAQTLVLGVSLQVCALVSPFYMQWMVDEALVAQDRDLAAVLALGFLALLATQSLMTAFRSWLISLLAANFNFQWLGNAFSHLMLLPLSYFEKRHLGDIVSRFGSIQTIQKSITTQAIEAVVDGILVTCVATLMLLYSPALTVVSCLTVAVYATIRSLLFRSMRAATAEQILHAAKQQTQLLESARGVQAIRLFDKVEERRASWLSALADQTNAELRISRLTVSYQAGNNILFGAERIGIIWYAAVLVMQGQLSVGMMLAFLSYKDQFSQRIASLVDKAFDFRMMRLHAERVADIVHTAPERMLAVTQVASIDYASADVEFRNVSFRYGVGEAPVLDGISLTIKAGQSVVFTGPSGCGKTTLVKLLLGLLEPSEGEILVGGVPLNRAGLQRWRAAVGAVMQEDGLFAGSIADNISFFDAESSAERVAAAAKRASLHAEIASMPMAYNTLIGDLGSGLSGGQRQRLLLARAFYKDPRILVLDEATSHLDIWNEQAVNQSIQQARLTRIMVAHRPETITMAERVVVLHAGKVLEDVIRDQQPAVMEPGLHVAS